MQRTVGTYQSAENCRNLSECRELCEPIRMLRTVQTNQNAERYVQTNQNAERTVQTNQNGENCAN